MQELLRTGIYFCKLEVNLPIHRTISEGNLLRITCQTPAKIREMFNDKDSSAFDDETLEMLYGMDEQKTERQIIIPFLEELFKTGDDYKDYINFLRRMYPEIVFEKGDVDGWSETECQSAQYYFIANQYGFKEEIDGEEIDVDYDRVPRSLPILIRIGTILKGGHLNVNWSILMISLLVIKVI